MLFMRLSLSSRYNADLIPYAVQPKPQLLNQHL